MGQGTAPVEISTKLQPLCYEHHVLMSPVNILIKGEMHLAPALAYACPEPGCLIHYNSPTGYFITPMPEVTCPHHKLPMYLAEVKPQNRSFRLWRCPQCAATHTNEEDLAQLE
jgi:hypothetical protein